MTGYDADDSQGIDYKDEETLRRLYYDEELSTNDIADLAGVTGGTIRNWMDRYGLDRRDTYEAASMKNRVEYARYRLDKDGYEVWQTHYNGTTERATVHQLLLVADGEDPFDVYNPSTDTHHERKIPWLNTPGNVTLLSTSEHQSGHHKGENHNLSKLTESDVREVRELSESGLTSFEIADRFDASPSAIRYAIRGDNWSHVE